MGNCALSSIGMIFEVSSTEPATQDPAGFAALTYTKVGVLLTFPVVGGTADITSSDPLETGQRCKSQGVIDWGQLPLESLYVEGDAGLEIMHQGLNGTFKGQDMAYKGTYPNGAIRYYRGFVSASTETVGSASDNIMSGVQVEINYEPIRVAAP